MKIIKYGLGWNGRLYGWIDGSLYSLPFESGNRYYSMRKATLQTIGKKTGYVLGRSLKTIDQLKEITYIINYKYTAPSNHKDLPF